MPKSSFPSNTKIAEMLREVSAAYEAKGEDRFKVLAYDKAAASVEHATSLIKDTWDRGDLMDIPGIGKSIASHLDEYFKTGEVAHFERVKKGLPEGMFSLLKIPNIGSKTAHRLAKELKLDGNAIKALREACLAGRVQALDGFGEKSESELLKSIDELNRRSDRMLLSQAWALADDLIDQVKNIPGVVRADPLGSVRRRVSTVGDVDIAVACQNAPQVIQAFVKLPRVEKVLASGDVKASVLLTDGRQVDFYTQSPESYGSLLQHLTGSKLHNIRLRTYAMEKGLSISENGVKVKKDNSLKTFSSEEKLYKFLGMDYIPPELREDIGEIQAALEANLPQLVELKDIQGDLHVHSNWDSPSPLGDGFTPVEELLTWAQEHRYTYLGLADHSPRTTIHSVAEVKKILKGRRQLYEKAQEKSSVKVLIGIEIDIFADGSLSLPNELLADFDYVIASVHTAHGQSQDVMTKRVIGALKNPQIKILGHPTGRLLNEREGFELDWEQIFQVCVDQNKILEINSSPTRLDLPDEIVREAVKSGVKLVVNTDAHELAHLEDMKYGVAVARRGWGEERDVINTLGWEDLLKVLRS